MKYEPKTIYYKFIVLLEVFENEQIDSVYVFHKQIESFVTLKKEKKRESLVYLKLSQNVTSEQKIGNGWRIVFTDFCEMQTTIEAFTGKCFLQC